MHVAIGDVLILNEVQNKLTQVPRHDTNDWKNRFYILCYIFHLYIFKITPAKFIIFKTCVSFVFMSTII